MLFNLVDNVLGTQSRVNLLRALVQSHRPLSGRETERMAGISHRPAIQALEELSGLGIISRERASGQNLYSINRKHILAQPIVALFEAEYSRVEKLFAWINKFCRGFSKHGDDVLGASIFGSAARVEDVPGSDLDLICVISHQRSVKTFREKLLSAAESVTPELGIKLSLVVLSIKDIKHRHKGGDLLMQKILKDERVVYGAGLSELIGDTSIG